MFARGTLARMAVAKTSARDLPQLARFLHRALLARNASASPTARALTRALAPAPHARRAYATTTNTTTPTATVKKAVKAKAASRATPRKSTAAKAAKKPAKKSAVKAKAKPKTKARTTKKAAPKKAAPKKRVKKQLTPDELQKTKMNELRKTALKVPVSYHAVTAFNVYVMEHGSGKAHGSQLARLSEIAPKFKTLSPAEREHYNHLAAEKTAARRAEYQAWIHSHTPEQINAANNARALLRRKLREQGKSPARSVYTPKLIDDRRPKQIPGPYALFCKERRLTGDFKGITISESAKLIGAEWKALSAGEKKKYQDEIAALKEERERELAAKS